MDQFTVVTASPNRQHFKEFLKTAGQLRFLPSWSFDDLPFCNLPGNAAARKRALKELFEVVGGIPRKIFDDKPLSFWKGKIAGQLKLHATDIRSLLSLYDEEIEDYYRAHNNLVIIHSTPPFDTARLFLSSTMFEHFIRKWLELLIEGSELRRLNPHGMIRLARSSSRLPSNRCF